MRTDGHTQPWGHCHATPRSNGGDARHTQDGNGTRQPRHSSAVLGRRRQTLENDANPGRQQRYRPPTGNAPTRTGPGRARRTGDSGPHVRRLRGMADCHLTCPRGRHLRGSPHVVERGHRGTLGRPGARARAPPARQGSHTGGRHGTDHRERIRPHETRQPDRTTGSPLGNNQGENPGGSGNGRRRRRRHRDRRGSTSTNHGRPQHAKGPKTPQRLRRMAGLAVRGPLPRKCWGRRAHIPRRGRRTTDDHRPLAREHGTGRQIRSRGGSSSGRARRTAPTPPRNSGTDTTGTEHSGRRRADWEPSRTPSGASSRTYKASATKQVPLRAPRSHASTHKCYGGADGSASATVNDHTPTRTERSTRTTAQTSSATRRGMMS